MPGTMKAAQLVAIGEPLQLREVPVPELGGEDVLVRIARCGFNGGDPHLVTGDVRVSPDYMPSVKLPLTFGHDGCGIVAQVGPRAQGFQVGDRVYISSSMDCGHCIYCRTNRAHICENKEARGWLTYKPNPSFAPYKDGFCAEYALAHYSHLHKLPDDVSFEVAGHLGILGVVYLAAKRARLGHGDVVVITGATGCTGAAAVLVSQLFNPRKIIAVARERRKLERLRAVDPHLIEAVSIVEEDLPQRLLELTEGQGADVLLDFIPRGAETTQQAIYRLRPGGRVVLVGGCTEEICVSYRFIMRYSLEISSSRGSSHPDIPVIMDFVRSGRLDLSPIAIRNFPLEEANEAMRALIERPGDDPLWVSVLPNPGLD
ncbi:MAG TPA: alcohol dehydrogenase catalytic domain-containing protein [Dehalococcoidia bacterium]|nr:alcohol dehydrogenase catalytic domain-containing protein [Dehalococcoidia bacterium]